MGPTSPSPPLLHPPPQTGLLFNHHPQIPERDPSPSKKKKKKSTAPFLCSKAPAGSLLQKLWALLPLSPAQAGRGRRAEAQRGLTAREAQLPVPQGQPTFLHFGEPRKLKEDSWNGKGLAGYLSPPPRVPGRQTYPTRRQRGGGGLALQLCLAFPKGETWLGELAVKKKIVCTYLLKANV